MASTSDTPYNAPMQHGFAPPTKERFVYIRSDHLKSDFDSTNTNLLVQLKDPIQATELQIIKAKLVDMIIPFSFYNLSAELLNNRLDWSYTGLTTSGTTTTSTGSWTSDPENYSVYTFINAISQEMDTFLINNSYRSAYHADTNPVGSQVSITYDRSKNKLVFRLDKSSDSNTLPSGDFTLQLATSAKNFCRLLGERGLDNTTFFGNSSYGSHTSEFAINLVTVRQLMISCNFGNQNMINIMRTTSSAESVTQDNLQVNKILGIIPITTSPFRFMNLSGSTNLPTIDLSTKEISNFSITITTDDGLPVSLNGLGWNATIRFTITRAPPRGMPDNMIDQFKSVKIRRPIDTNIRKELTAQKQDAKPRDKENLEKVKERAEKNIRATPAAEVNNLREIFKADVDKHLKKADTKKKRKRKSSS